MDGGKQHTQSHLLLLRVWADDRSSPQAQGEWKGRLQHVLSGEARTFRACPQLIDLVLELLATDGHRDNNE
jgi:hypothetical protein